MEKSNQTFTTGIWNVKPGKEKEFIKAWKEFAEWTFSHVDSGHAQLMKNADENTSKFISVGTWQKSDSIKNWRETGEYKNALKKINDLLVEPSQPHKMEIVETVGEKVMM